MLNNVNRGFSFSEINSKDGTSEIQILRTGQWSHPVYNKFTITEEDLDQFVANFKNRVKGVDLAVDINHDPECKAVGWYKDIYKKGKALFAKIEWTPEGKELVENKTYRYFSPELHFEFQDEESGEKIRNVLVGGGITNRPFFKNMKALTMSEPKPTDKPQILYYNSESMNFNELYNQLKDKQALNAEEYNNLAFAFTELTKEEQAANSDKMAEVENRVEAEADTTEEVTETTEIVEDTAVEEEATTEVEEVVEEATEPTDEPTKEFSETITTAKFNEFLTKELGMDLPAVKEMQKKFSEQAKALKFKEMEGKVNSLVFSENNSKGVFLPKSKEKLAGFLSKLNDNLVKEFFEVVPNSVKTVEFKELGKEGKEVAAKFSVPTNTPAGQDRESYVLAELANQFSEKEGLEYTDALLAAEKYIKENNIK